jgi:multidrug efflux pump
VFARFFIDRPIFSWVISLVILLVGVVAVVFLPIAQYPEITPPTVTVTALYPGANAQVVADSVAAPIEQQVSGVDRMLYMSSQCTNDGAYTLTITFDLGTDSNTNQVLVQNRVALAEAQLPPQVQVQGVSTRKKSPSILLVVNLISPDNSYDDLYLSNYATLQIKDALLRLPGVGDVTYLGQRDYSMRVWLNPERMAALSLTSTDVVKAVQSQNVQVAAGQIGQQPVPSGQQTQLTMSTLGRLDGIDQFKRIILKSAQPREGGGSTPVVYLEDVARVELGSQSYDQIARLDGTSTVGLAVFQLPGSNALDVAKDIKREMETLKARFPRGVDYRIVYDTTPFVSQSIDEVVKTLFEAVLLVAVVVLLFLQDWKAMILPMIDVPVSLVGTFAVMFLLGFTLNTLTLFGLVLAIGIVVDDAIMVLENIERFIAKGEEPREATLKAMSELIGPIVAVTLVLSAVFIPAAFLPGVNGQFYRQFALTIASAMVISAVNAMTLTPSRAVTIFKSNKGGHAAREALPWWIFGIVGAYLTYKFGKHLAAGYLGVPEEGTPEYGRLPSYVPYEVMAVAAAPGFALGLVVGWFIIRPVNAALGAFFRAFNRVFEMVTRGYGRAVSGALRVSIVVLLIYGGLLVLTFGGLAKSPKGFLPNQDQGYLLVNVQLRDAASVQRTLEIMKKIERIALGDDHPNYKGGAAAPDAKRYEGIPGVAHTVVVCGQSVLLGANGSNFGTCFLTLEPFDERHGSREKYDAEVARKAQELFGAEIDDAVISVFRAPPIQGLGAAGGIKIMTEQRGFVDLLELQTTTNDFVKAALESQVGYAFTQYSAGTPQLFVDIDRTKCEAQGLDLSEVTNTLQVYMGTTFVNLFNRFGRTWQVNLSADERFRTDPKFLRDLKIRNRQGKMVPFGSVAEVRPISGPIIVTRYNLYSAASVLVMPAPGVSSGEAIAALNANAERLGVPIEYSEISYLELKSGDPTLFIFGLGSLLVYLVLAAQYESWSLPLAVILIVPMCLLCAVAGMFIAKLPIDIFVQIGFLVLVGLAAKNAILIVEFARQLRAEGKSARDAAVEAAGVRLRPILMTSFAFILGVFPLVIGEGAGAEMRRSLGTAVFSGMIGVTVFGIFLTPVFFFVVQWMTEGKAAPVAGVGHAPGPHQDGVYADGVAPARSEAIRGQDRPG